MLRAMARGIEPDSAAVERTTGVALETWQGLMERMGAARYGVLFYGTQSSCGRPVPLIAHAAHALVREMNARTRFVCLPLQGGGNLPGARNVLAWSTGYSSAVSLARGYPRFGPGEFSAESILRRGEADAALIVSDDPVSRLAGPAREHLSRIPSIWLSSEGIESGFDATVVLRTAPFGIDTPGTAYRMDGVPLPLRTVLASSVPRGEDVLRAIESRVRSFANAGGHIPCP
jgi:formylmethanofuran dehydrogenase subunit B